MLAPDAIADIVRQLESLRDEWRVLKREAEATERAPLPVDAEDEARDAERLIDLEDDMRRLMQRGDDVFALLPEAEQDRLFDPLHPEMWD